MRRNNKAIISSSGWHLYCPRFLFFFFFSPPNVTSFARLAFPPFLVLICWTIYCLVCRLPQFRLIRSAVFLDLSLCQSLFLILSLPSGFCFIPPSVFSLSLIYPSLSFGLIFPALPDSVVFPFLFFHDLLLLPNPQVFVFLHHLSLISLHFIIKTSLPPLTLVKYTLTLRIECCPLSFPFFLCLRCELTEVLTQWFNT